MPLRPSKCVGWYFGMYGKFFFLSFEAKIFTLLVPSHRRKVLLVGERGAVVPLLTCAASALWRPSSSFGGEWGAQWHGGQKDTVALAGTGYLKSYGSGVTTHMCGTRGSRPGKSWPRAPFARDVPAPAAPPPNQTRANRDKEEGAVWHAPHERDPLKGFGVGCVVRVMERALWQGVCTEPQAPVPPVQWRNESPTILFLRFVWHSPPSPPPNSFGGPSVGLVPI